MDEYSSEKEQIEEIKKWWKDNGAFIVTGLIVGFGALGGWKYWQAYKEQRAATASAHYEELTIALGRGDTNGANELLGRLADEFAATPYAATGALAMAKYYAINDKPELAGEQLRGVIDNTKDEYLALVARTRLARLMLAQDQPDEALQLLAVSDPGSFTARFHEVRGDAYAALGRHDDARIEYLSALNQFEQGLVDREFIEMKLNDLGRTSAGAGSEPADPDA
ncbi:MAG: tetratricopeptide repeat protein [Gammaproteobacteria bacterium]|nr:tetratricopeptide repeat protein [Gammaproteobacteria bacterium]NNF61655.1 tetratricopeptide repeat protein [Gammaproteobacteria bacterium]NNM20539.1 tetratricopeptide repeat protein [Gammaproteobacteria bacterium]